jgi:hypothetical protein
MDSHTTSKIRIATSPYFVVMLIIWPVVRAYRDGAELASFGTLLIIWWLLAAAGSILNCRKWHRLNLPGRFGVVVLGFIAIAPWAYLAFGWIAGLFYEVYSLFL